LPRKIGIVDQRATLTVALLTGDFRYPCEATTHFRANPGSASVLISKEMSGNTPAVILIAQPPTLRYPDLGEKNLVELVLASNIDDWSYLDSGAVHINQQERDARLLAPLLTGSDQAEDAICVLRECGPDFRAIEHIVLTVALRAKR
jgi:hypothetical protein